MKFIHIVRNPFDNIATMVLRRAGERDNVREEGAKVSWFMIFEKLSNYILIISNIIIIIIIIYT